MGYLKYDFNKWRGIINVTIFMSCQRKNYLFKLGIIKYKTWCKMHINNIVYRGDKRVFQ